ncbi:MAG: class I SAM-dependent methyltransferase [Bacilli bacterium]|jgi:ubiquinone/menaquinone biosynthesis C-methylase UbiE
MGKDFNKYRRNGDYHWRWYDEKSRYKTHVDRIVAWIKEKNVLDIGAGDGLITSKIGAIGIDNELDGVKIAREKGVNVILADAYDLPFDNEHFESAFMGDTLEHLEFPQEAVKEARRVISMFLYLAVPTKQKWKDELQFEDWTEQELVDMVEKQGFKLEGKIESTRTLMYAKFHKI